LIDLKNVFKSFDKTEALKGINLNIEDGSFFGLLGPNGAGKTTLLNILIGFIQADSGEILLDKKPIDFENLNYKKKFGYVPQEIALYNELSAEKNLEIFGGLYGLSGKKLSAQIDETLDLVGLSERRKDNIKTFSGGMKRRINIACSILHNPEIILCDEPTVGVDPQSRNAIFDMLQHLNIEKNKTIIYTTHYMEEAARLCSKMAIIDYGKIIAEGNLTELTNLLDKKESVKILKDKISIGKLEDLRKLGRVIELEYQFELTPHNEFSKLSLLFTRLEELGIPDDNIEISRATLEDVFLHLTGRRLRD
jgi:ABC-2 type transport system ATP-binding protein